MIPQSLIRPAVDDVRDVVSVFDASRLMDEAIEIALRYQRSAYDALYVALALQEGCPLVTADRRLYDAVAVELPGVVLWIEDVP